MARRHNKAYSIIIIFHDNAICTIQNKSYILDNVIVLNEKHSESKRYASPTLIYHGDLLEYTKLTKLQRDHVVLNMNNQCVSRVRKTWLRGINCFSF